MRICVMRLYYFLHFCINFSSSSRKKTGNKRAPLLISASEESECLGLTSSSRYFTQHNQEQALWVIMMSSLRWFTADGSRDYERHSWKLQTETRCYKCSAGYRNDPPRQVSNHQATLAKAWHHLFSTQGSMSQTKVCVFIWLFSEDISVFHILIIDNQA